MMASPEPTPTTPPVDRTAHVHALLARLGAEPAKGDLGELYDLTSSTVYGWSLSTTPHPAAAEEVTVAVYLHLWQHSTRYPQQLSRPWPWLRAALLIALQQHRGPTSEQQLTN